MRLYETSNPELYHKNRMKTKNLETGDIIDSGFGDVNPNYGKKKAGPEKPLIERNRKKISSKINTKRRRGYTTRSGKITDQG